MSGAAALPKTQAPERGGSNSARDEAQPPHGRCAGRRSSITSLGVVMGGLNTSIVVSLPCRRSLRGLNVDPLARENASLLLWMLMGFPVVTTTLLVTIGRASDMFGRVRMYVLGFAIFTVASALLSLVWSSGTTGALEIIGLRLVQAIGSAFLSPAAPRSSPISSPPISAASPWARTSWP